MWIYILYCFIFTIIVRTVKSASDLDVRDLHTELFTIRSYNKLVRPSFNQSEPIYVYVEYYLFGINDVDEVEQKVTTTGYLVVFWQDQFLDWDPSLFGNLQYLHVPQGSVWKPDISLQNGFKNLAELGSSFIYVYITSQGYVLWQPFQIFESKCDLDPTYFPFDKQTCHLDFVVWSLDSYDVLLFVGTNGINMERAVESNGQWTVVSSSAADSIETTESRVRFSIVMRRKPLFVVMNIIIPIILLSILNIFTFQIPADIGERMGYTITVWLAFAVFLTIVSSSLPKNSDSVPVISIYIMIQLAIGTITVLISAVESRIVCCSDEQAVYSILRRLALLLRRIRIKPKDSVEKLNIGIGWKEGVAALDTVCFWTFFIVLVSTTFIILMIAAKGG